MRKAFLSLVKDPKDGIEGSGVFGAEEVTRDLAGRLDEVLGLLGGSSAPKVTRGESQINADKSRSFIPVSIAKI